MKPLLTRVESLDCLLAGGTKPVTFCALALLLCGPGCQDRARVSEAAPAHSTNAEPATNGIGRTQDAPSLPALLTNITTLDDNAPTNLLSVWRSPHATPEERATAITRWLPADTDISSAKALLGGSGRLSHYFGPSFDAPRGTNAGVALQTGAIDVWLLEYDTPRGVVALRFSFERGGTNRWRFDGAYAGKVVIQ